MLVYAVSQMSMKFQMSGFCKQNPNSGKPGKLKKGFYEQKCKSNTKLGKNRSQTTANMVTDLTGNGKYKSGNKNEPAQERKHKGNK